MTHGSSFIKAAVIGLLTATSIVATFISAPAMAATLSATEAADLTFQREEEKLARDVYLTLYNRWGATIFNNIAGSEQKHTDTMLKMLLKYKLSDPAKTNIGEFTNTVLQAKYNELVAEGLTSYVDGLSVGASIEELDMVDLQHAIQNTKRVDLLTAYQNLLEGSKNHLRAFVAGLAAQGVTYTPTLISHELYDAIIGL
jgi:hypothetical protein